MKNTVKAGILGVVTGFINGLFGAGGGTILVPAMQRILKVEVHKSHATTIAVILPLSILSAFVYLRNTPVEWLVVLYVSIGGAAGGYIGAKLLNKISKNKLHKIFGAFMVMAAVRMIWG